MPMPTHGVKIAAMTWVQLERESCPTSFMPRDRATSPKAPKKMTPARVACLRKDTRRSQAFTGSTEGSRSPSGVTEGGGVGGSIDCWARWSLAHFLRLERVLRNAFA